ncbi:SDR family NAD(P)-dependent oxidoreductase [Stappia sp.]|uniref:SDR family NAD(P)-dependent oxidoreductase n=1 Tax=Stappia sp. TaxID=1870903 RepID=UPI003A993612
MSNALNSFPSGGVAVVIGASGGLGSAFLSRLEGSGRFAHVVGCSRRGVPRIDLEDEASIADAAAHVAGLGELRLVVDATGILSDGAMVPEKALARIDANQMARSFRINAIGPALLIRHFAPLFPRQGKSVFATLSARVGSIGENALGGWISYRAAKAALNQIVRTASIELARSRPEHVLLALHPGTVETALSRPFARSGLAIRTPDEAAGRLLTVIDGVDGGDTGSFLSYTGERLPW